MDCVSDLDSDAVSAMIEATTCLEPLLDWNERSCVDEQRVRFFGDDHGDDDEWYPFATRGRVSVRPTEPGGSVPLELLERVKTVGEVSHAEGRVVDIDPDLRDGAGKIVEHDVSSLLLDWDGIELAELTSGTEPRHVGEFALSSAALTRGEFVIGGRYMVTSSAGLSESFELVGLFDYGRTPDTIVVIAIGLPDAIRFANNGSGYDRLDVTVGGPREEVVDAISALADRVSSQLVTAEATAPFSPTYRSTSLMIPMISCLSETERSIALTALTGSPRSVAESDCVLRRLVATGDLGTLDLPACDEP